jgi:hypothetical protein
MRRSFLLPLVAAAIAVQAVGPAPSRAAQFWVGNGGVAPCTHATLQEAVGAAQALPGTDFIYLVGPGPYDGQVAIVGGGLTIVGGVSACTDVVSRGYATVRAPSGTRPLSILMSSGSVLLRRLRITTDHGTLDSDGGAVWFSGGGPASSLILDDCQVVDSVALGDGGGIYVSNARVSLNQGAQVSANTAFFDGGGLHVAGAQIQLGTTSPGISGPLPAPLVVSNIAGDEGGGLYLADTTLLSFVLAAADAPPVGIGGNQARRGGGIFLSNANLRLERAELYFNRAGAEGGGAALVAGAVLTAPHGPGSPLVGGYPQFTGNDALRGGSLFVDRSQVSLGSGTVLDHDAGAGDATVSATGPTSLNLTGVAFTRNQVRALIALEEDVSLALTHVSIAGNQAGGLVDWEGRFSRVEVTATALDETEPFFVGFGTPQIPPGFRCVISRHGSTLDNVPPSTDLSTVLFADPGFLAPQAGDLHIRTGSPAIDLCADLTDSSHDLDGEPRGFDFDGPITPAGRRWDAGVDERTSFPGRYFTVTPCRALDTRQPGQGPALGNGAARVVPVRGVCGIPLTARAVALNVTAVTPTSGGHLTLYPAGIATPGTSTINFRAGVTRANNGIIQLSLTGDLEARAALSGGKVHLIVDIAGYFE